MPPATEEEPAAEQARQVPLGLPFPSACAAWSPPGEGLPIRRFEVINRIADGAYGTVFRARDRESGRIVALKQMRISALQQQGEGFPVSVLRELAAMRAVNHPSLLTMLGVCVVQGKSRAAGDAAAEAWTVYLVLEYCEHDVRSFQAALGRHFSEAEVKCLAVQLLEGLAAMHRRWRFHRDLKPANLLCSNDGELRLADFGLARQFEAPPRRGTTPRLVVTPTYRSIELLLGDHAYGPALDVWSAGCIIAELLTGKRLFKASSEAELALAILRVIGSPTEAEWPGWRELPYVAALRGLRGIASIPTESRPARLREHLGLPATSVSGRGCLSDEGLDLLVAMLAPNPTARISADAALSHPWLTTAAPRPQRRELMPHIPSTNERASREAQDDDDAAWSTRAAAVRARMALSLDR